jgi:predicted ATPase
MQESLSLAQALSHPFSLAFALQTAAEFHVFCQDGRTAQEQTEALMILSREQGFALRAATGTILRGWALAEQGQVGEGVAQMREGLAFCRTAGAELYASKFLTLLVWTYGKVGQVEEGLTLLAEALVLVDKTGARVSEAELYRLKGELTLQLKVESYKSQVEEAEECFLKAIDIARRQQAKMLELRATVSLAWLWQQQGKHHEARQRLAEIYHWFTEGFDTVDLKEAKTLLEELER